MRNGNKSDSKERVGFNHSYCGTSILRPSLLKHSLFYKQSSLPLAIFGGDESDLGEKNYVLVTLLWVLVLMNFPREFVIYLQPGLDPEFWLLQIP